MIKSIKLVIFDLDGTLVDAYRPISDSFNYTMHSFNIPEQRPYTIRRAVGWGDENLLKPFVNLGDLRKALIIYRRHYKKALLAGSRLLPDVKRALGYLKAKGYRLAVASNRHRKFSWILIRHLGLRKYFDYVLCQDKLKQGKPHPKILNRIMQRLSVKPSQTVYVGDMIIDVQAGKRAGVKTIIVTTGSSTREEIKKEKPYKIIRGINELLEIL